MYTFEISDHNTLDITTETALYELAEPLCMDYLHRGGEGFTWNDNVDYTEQGDFITVSHGITIGKEIASAKDIAGTFTGLEIAGRQLDLEKPPVRVWLRADEAEWRFLMDVVVSRQKRNDISNLTDEGKNQLARVMKLGMWRVACNLDPAMYNGKLNTNLSYPFDAFVHKNGMFHLTCPGQETGLDPYIDTKTGDVRLVPHNLDNARQQLTLLGGIAVLNGLSLQDK
jgi:hypothetical protein